MMDDVVTIGSRDSICNGTRHSDNTALVSTAFSDPSTAFFSVKAVDDEELAARYSARMPSREEVHRRMTIDAAKATEIHVFKKGVEENNNRCRRYLILFGTIIVIVAIALGVFFSKKTKDIPKTVEVPSPNFAYTQELLLDLSGDALFDESSNQYRALEWLVYDDPAKLDLQNTDLSTIINRYVIALFYFATNGPEWLVQYNYLSNASVCDWGEIICDVNGELTWLEQFQNNLTGTIPSELSAIKTLERINLPINNLYGTMPSSLGELSHLKFLQFALNSVTGSIPESYEKLTKLEILNLGYNQISGTIPQNIIKDASNMKTFNLRFNLLSGSIPSDFGRNNEMIVYVLGDNLLEGTIPESIFIQPNIEYIFLNSNSLTGTIPSVEVGALQYVSHIYIYTNQLTGTLPSSFGTLDYLQYLYVTSNKLSGMIPTEIGNILDLIDLAVNDNQFTGTIPSELGSLKKLQRLFAEQNSFTGILPSTLSMLSILDIVDFSNTSIVGDVDNLFCDFNERKPLGFLSSDCGGLNPEVTCSCCNKCCDDDSTCEIKFNEICEMTASTVANGQFFNDDKLQSICTCTDDGTSFSCIQEDPNICQTCNEDSTVCGIQTDYGWGFNENGIRETWKTSFEYISGRNETVSFLYDLSTLTCMVHVNGEECASCNTIHCRDEFETLKVECRNLIDDGSGHYHGCENYDSTGIFSVFDMHYTRSYTGCSPFWYFDEEWT